MAKPATPGASAPALPAIGEISSVKPDALPPSGARPSLDENEIALAKVIIAAATGDNAGNVAVGPKLADRKAATAAAARIKRLVTSYFVSQGTAPNDRPTIATRSVPKDGGYAWGVTINPAHSGENADDAAAADADAANAETAAETASTASA